MTIKISIEKLEQIFNLLMEKSKKIDMIQEIEIETDYYWIITTDEWENFNSDSSPVPCVGSIIDDWASLQTVLNNQEIITVVDYDRFANILRAIAEKMSSP